MREITNPIISAEEVKEGILELAKPIDFEQLIRDGVLEKDGAWYKVLDFKNLPKHASRKLKTIETGPKGTRVKFYPVTKATLKLAERLRG